MRLFAVLIAITLFASAACNRPFPAAQQGAACAAATAYVEDSLASKSQRRSVFSIKPQWLAQNPDRGSWFDPRSDGKGVIPPRGLVMQLRQGGVPSAVARCPSVRSVLAHHNVAYGDRAVKSAQQIVKGTALYKADVQGVSLPAVSADGTKALLISSGIAGLTAGGGYLVYLKRSPSGAWTVVSSASLWVA